MAIHDWTKIFAGAFHDFRLGWIVDLSNALNSTLRADFYCLIEAPATYDENDETIRSLPESAVYAEKADHLAIRSVHGDSLVAVIEMTSPGHAEFTDQKRQLMNRIEDWIRQQAKLVIVDLFEALASETIDELCQNGCVIKLEPGNFVDDPTISVDNSYSIRVPLNTTYEATWNRYAAPLKELIESQSA
ncbi:MAG: hypothetical protein WKF77_05815 [Planctomycetaceae bacterium]